MAAERATIVSDAERGGPKFPPEGGYTRTAPVYMFKKKKKEYKVIR